MSQALDFPITVPLGSLEAYTQAVQRMPMLSEGEERALAERYHQYGDLEAARRLVLSHLRFVVRVARGYSGYGLPQADLIQEGNIGLMKAVKRFDPTLGVRLVSFAAYWIRAEIYEYILRNWRIVKVATTKAQRKLFFNLRRARRRPGWLNREEVESVARDLNVAPRTVLEMEDRLSARDSSFDPYPGADDDHFAPADTLPDRRFDPAVTVEQEEIHRDHDGRLHRALATLDGRSREIIAQRWLSEDKSTLQSLAERYSVSIERIRQIEQSAIKKL
ncbi:MAG: RNA polymerase sigma factor RpoH, partial [Gammaproteobacteria bacterium]